MIEAYPLDPFEPLESAFEGFEATFGASQDEAKRFAIDNDDKAEWALERILEEEAEAERFIGLCERKIAMLMDQVEAERERITLKTSFLKTELSIYMRTVTCRETKTQKTYRLASGDLVYKLPKHDFSHDDAAIIAYCKENAPEYVKIVEALAWGEYKKRLGKVEVPGDENAPTEYRAVDTETGEFVPGITVTEKPGVFTIKAAKGAKA